MSDELTILDQVDTFGFPWHGLYRKATSDVLLPSGATKALSAVGLTSGTPPQDGDCYRVQHPDAPGAVTSAEETAQGMSWLDYALFAGSGRRYGGDEIGAKRWVYVAPDGSVWLVNLPIIGTAVGTGALSTTLTLSPFGRLGEPEDPAPTSQSIAVSISSDWFTADYAPYYDDNRLYIDDINPTGSRALITPGISFGMLELRISGTPPAATAELVALWSITEGKGVEFATSTITDAAVGLRTKPVGSGTASSGVSGVRLGAFYAPDGVTVTPVLYTAQVDSTRSFSWTLDASGYYIIDYYNTQSVVASAEISVAGRSVRWEITASETAESDGGNLVNRSVTLPFQPLTLTFSGTDGSSSPIVDNDQLSGLSTIMWHSFPDRLEHLAFKIQAMRYGNGLWGLVVVDKTGALWPSPPSLYLYRANSTLVGKVANGGVAVSEVNGGNVRRFASEHPVSGAIAHDVSVVCWI